MATVMHARLRSQMIITSSGPMTLDSKGHFEVSEAVADYLCDETKYNGTFKRVEDSVSLPEPEAQEVLEGVEAEEEVIEEVEAPARKKKVRRKKKISKKVRA